MTLSSKTKYIDFFSLYCIGAVSFGYVVFVRPFAELHMQFSFLDFPIFIGEILLSICLLLFAAKYTLSPQAISKSHYLIISYFIFVIGKALWGYFKWGPLALRHAALLYYPVFAVFGYCFFRRDFFDQKKRILIFVLVVLMFVLQKESMLWPLSGFILGVVLLIDHSSKIVKYSLFLLLCFNAPFNFIFRNSRTLVVGHIASLVYLAGSAYFISGLKTKLKCAVLFVVLLLGVFTYLAVHREGLSTFMDVNEVRSVIDRYDEIRRERVEDYQPLDLRVNLYNPEKGKEYGKENAPGETEKETAIESIAAQPARVGLLPGGKQEFWDKREAGADRSFYSAAGSMAFRYFIWQDMLHELFNSKPVFGFDFGKPLRSPSIETIVIGSNEWKRDGWIEAHNSFLHIIYRTGIVGVTFIVFIFFNLFNMAKFCIQSKLWIGILLCAVIIQWFASANFMPIFELPYTAIPIWSLCGMTWAYCQSKVTKEILHYFYQDKFVSQDT